MSRMTRRQVIVGAGVVVGLVVLVAVLLTFATGVARARGGGIQADVVRSGVASDLRCSPNPASLGADWTCRAAQISWQQGKLPPGVTEQRPPYEVLAVTDLTGTSVAVTSHLPMGWDTTGSGMRSELPTEIIVAEGHPVGSGPWWAFQVWAPPVAVVVAVGVAAALGAASQHRRRRRRRG